MKIFNRAFGINLAVMRIFGLYPPQKYQQFYRIYGWTVYFVFIVPIPILATLYLFLEENIDMRKISENAFMVCQTACFIFKFVPFISKVNELRSNVYMMETAIFKMCMQNQEEIINEFIRDCRINANVFMIFCLVTVSTWAMVPFLGEELKLPLDIWLPFELTTRNYFIFYFYILFAVIADAFLNGVIDPLIAGMAYFTTSQLKILKKNLRCLNEYADEEIIKVMENDAQFQSKDIEFLKSKLIFDKIKLCIDHHTAVIQFVDRYENTFSSVVFSQFLASVVVICISCLQLSMVEPFTFTFFAMIIFTFTILLEIFFYCYYGTTLFEESNSLTDAIYMGTWYDYDMKSKKALITLMERSKRPMTVTAGKILELSLMTFTMILKRSYSLLAVLRNY